MIWDQQRDDEWNGWTWRKFNRTLRYSNPELTHHGAPTGIENERDNARWIRDQKGCFVAGYLPDPPVPLEAHIVGESFLCQPLIGTYWALANGDHSPFQYEWHLSTDGINWGNVVSTDSYLDVDSYNYPIGSKVFLRLKVTDSLGKEVFAFFDILIGYADGPAGCMRYSEDREEGAVFEHELSVYPNPMQDAFQIEFFVTEEMANAGIRLYTPTGNLLYSNDRHVSRGANVETIRLNTEYKGPLMLDVRVGTKHFNKLILKH
jgi:hypothetical protein